MKPKTSAILVVGLLIVTLIVTVISNTLTDSTNASSLRIVPRNTSRSAFQLEDRAEITRDRAAHRVYLPYWTTAAGFYTKIYIRNVNVLQPMVASLYLITKNRPAKVKKVEIEPAQTFSIDVQETLITNALPYSDEGSAFIDFEAESVGAINAFAQIVNPNQSVALSFPFQRVESKAEKILNAVAWFYDRDTEVNISIQNTSKKKIVATPTLYLGESPIRLEDVKLKAHGATTIRLPKLQSTDGPFPVGVSLGHDGEPGSLIAQGWATSVARGFSTGFSFTAKRDCDCADEQNRLYGTGIPIGSSSMMRGAVFDPVLVLRNVSEKALTVTPSFTYMLADVPGKVALPSVTLAPQETTLNKLRQYQVAGIIPSTVAGGGIELLYQGKTGDLIAEMASVDETGFYTSPVPLVCGGKAALHMSYWRTDGDWDSILQIENISKDESNAEITITYPGGSFVVDKRLRAGELAMISVKQLQQTQAVDKNGTKIPLSATVGGMNIWNKNSSQALVINGLIVNPVTGTCGYCGAFGQLQYYGLTDTPQNCFYSPFAEYSVNESVALFMYLYFDTGQCGSDGVQDIQISTPSILQALDGSTLWTIGAGYGTFSATTQGAWSDCYDPLPVTTTGGFEVFVRPRVDNITPALGPIDSSVGISIIGSGFGNSPSVNIGGTGITASIQSSSSTSISVTLNISATAGGGDHGIIVTANGQPSNSMNFFVQIPTKLQRNSMSALQNEGGCGAVRNLSYTLLDQNGDGDPIDTNGTISEGVSSFNGPPGVQPPPETQRTMSHGTFPDVVGYSIATCPPPFTATFVQSFTVHLNTPGHAWALSSQNSVSMGRTSAGAKFVDITFTQ